MITTHTQHMQRAYDLAFKGWGKTSPNPMVGAVIVKGGKVIAEGWHARCGSDHAEAMALKKAGAKAKGAHLYVTLEPCSHFGRTPPCTDVIIRLGIKKVFVGVKDPNPRMNGKSIALLRKAGIEVEVGFMEEALLRLNEGFITYITTGFPHVTAKIAQTIDGKIATLTGESKWITAHEARDVARQMRNGFDGIMVGINTVLADDPKLTAADPSKRLKKIILDSSLKLPLNATLFKNTSANDVIVITTSKARASKIKALSSRATVWVAPQKGHGVNLSWALKELAKNEIAAILIEGGGRLIGSALNEGLVHKMHIYIVPKIMGQGIEAIQGIKTRHLADMIDLKNISIGHIGNDVFIEGYCHVHRNH